MLLVTADIFSGCPNPTWMIENEGEVRAVLKEIASNRGIIATVDAVGAGPALGYRGLIIEPTSDEMAKDFDLPAAFRLPAGTALGSKGQEISERLIRLIPSEKVAEWGGAPEESVQAYLLDQMVISSRVSVPDSPGVTPKGGTGHEDTFSSEAAVISPEAAVTCYYERAAYNPGFWNNDPTTLRWNNCYNYASNKKTNTFAQPGLGCGHMYTVVTCAEVTRAALCDGLHRRFDCFPDSEKPRYLVALVIKPTPRTDFHWYRLNKEVFWSHKPGNTPVRNVDNSGKVITNPETCDRGPYTQFCGYFYTCKSQKIK